MRIVDAQQHMLDARQIKSQDEIMPLNQAAAMVDGGYPDIVEALKPGIRENEIAALANKRLYKLGSDQVEAINAVSGERCNPHPRNFSDQMVRPGDQAFSDIIHSFNGYRTCYYRTFAVGSAAQELFIAASIDPTRRRYAGSGEKTSPQVDAIGADGAGSPRAGRSRGR